MDSKRPEKIADHSATAGGAEIDDFLLFVITRLGDAWEKSEEKAMGKISVNKTGLAFGLLMAGCHLVWALLVAVGWAQIYLDFIFWLHFLSQPFVLQPFHAGTAALLVLVTGAIGYLGGFIFASIWNWVQR